MPLRRLALACLAACSPAPQPDTAPAVAAAAPPVAVTPVPTPAQPPVPKDSPPPSPRLLHRKLVDFAPLADGSLLVQIDYASQQDVRRLDVATGTLTPWPQDWHPPAGWGVEDPKAVSSSELRVNAAGTWVARAHVFTPKLAPKPDEDELVAIVVARADGSEARCVGVSLLEDEGELPAFTFLRGGRLIGGWSGQCEPDARGRARSFERGARFAARTRPLRWVDPQTGEVGEVPDTGYYGKRDPLGDLVVGPHFADGKVWLAIRDIATGKQLATFAGRPEPALMVSGWASADAALADVYDEDGTRPTGQRLLYTDGRVVATPGPGWRVYTRLPGDELLFTRDDGASVEQGRVDWSTFTPGPTRTRADLQQFAAPIDRNDDPPAWKLGLGGVLIHEQKSGALYFAPV